ncbi:MAG: hypothetical protein PVF91_10990 [Chromatiales bacterium]|jgi:hypothetical protein
MYIDSLSIAGMAVSIVVVVMLAIMFPKWRADFREEEVRDDEED